MPVYNIWATVLQHLTFNQRFIKFNDISLLLEIYVISQASYKITTLNGMHTGRRASVIPND